MENLLCIHHNFDFSQLLTPLIAIVGAIIAIVQLAKNNKTRRADFAHRLDIEFFTEETTNCFEIIEFLKFIEPQNQDNYPFFEINKAKIKKLPKGYFAIKEFCKERGYEMRASELDDYLLGQFEKIGLYRKKKVIDMQYVYELFDFYIRETHSNKEIQKYIEWIRKSDNSKETYDKFDFIAKECKKFEKIKNRSPYLQLLTRGKIHWG